MYLKFERQASKHACCRGTTVALNTLRYPRRAARGQHVGARCGCFGSERLPASIAQLLTPASRMGDACPPGSTCGRATNRREKAFTFCGHWWPGSARAWPDRCACGVISAMALRRVNMERFRDVLVLGGSIWLESKARDLTVDNGATSPFRPQPKRLEICPHSLYAVSSLI